ncbi:peroxiredoxin [Acidithiobacillus sp. CV18-2]|uniref:Thioredoxin peroxidase n=1 Tax=Igneacidithiobacillus copahuensis TaxID=2724909 RepID=A0AAE2YRZ2_9PROT|nr:peroxiredoxin [Igneacidithiobacillus copahuensis]MBU2754111.1 peroxiredoxin [Acidithiobacillus sp. CV18-3]MBU2756988.1 peroxiredoxin [Acidithiobacillus sp. BN09-2]MBU2777842.1 peroxiredoxin [Acidithiobacillus sp. CV18-2]MBU2795589.1 peroxiredoxin [Acidithiobacillus sp. VAN18-2]MBU2798817.1 peroxiredoxin [Acidithiobacillus sp. VAN18-4]UTV81780.1 peroxiredoxin [Acidithiobacillus sp. YTS05]
MAVLVGKKAPDFVAPAVMPDNSINEKFHLSQYIKGKYAVLFFYPLDFTFVCPSEIIAFNHRLSEFHARKTEVISCSIDSHFTHLAWKNTPENKGGIGNIQLPMVADLTKQIARDYDVLFDESVALRGSFLIDRDGLVRHQVVNDLPLGRNIDEMIRMVDALQFFEEHGEVCPAQWEKGKSGMKADSAGVASYLAEHAKDL